MTRVALLWHMHQPLYQDLLTGEHILPWVRLHALKDYWGMVALLREFPAMRLTFNLVPSMLVQLEAFARDEARDRHLEIGLKRADTLTEEERAFAIANFFHAHGPRMIGPHPRYAELAGMRDAAAQSQLSVRGQSARFSVDDLRDLQVWHKLAWIDPFYQTGDARARALIEKGRGFTEEDKESLRAVELELLRRVVPEYREASERGQVELSTSPFYHPILPLLCDTDVYRRTHPDSRMPREPFRHPEDAAEQLSRAVAYHEQLFGRRPVGLWPSEGSVSDAMVPLVVQAGFQWMATDEEILARTVRQGFTRTGDGHVEQPERLYRAYRVGPGDAAVSCGFRDHALSDLIGFTYAGWSAEGAADDFVRRVVEAGRRFGAANEGEATVFVILDGENAWEHYEDQGRPFLRALYGKLSSHPELRTVTMGEACAGAAESLPSIFPGSWINGDFYIWIGHTDDHRAWGQLVDARRALESPPAGLGDSALARAREEMLIAEGSDWFWWYGDDHSSEHDLEFDELFRRHVRNVYRALEKPIPDELFVTNITTSPPASQIQRPTGFVTPTIDGEITSYFEWVGAGSVEGAAAGGAMHQVAEQAEGIAAVEFGFDLENLYVRVDATSPVTQMLAAGFKLVVRFLSPVGLRIELGEGGAGTAPTLYRSADGDRWSVVAEPRLRAAVGRVAEIQIPFEVLGAVAGERVAMFVLVRQGDTDVERQPRHQAIEFEVPDQRFSMSTWTA